MIVTTKKEFLAKLQAINPHEPKDKSGRNKLVCALIGHSKICDAFFGYRYCGRCGDTLGDSLVGYDYGAKDAVIIGHKCAQCVINYKNCTWKDKLYVPNPFK